MRYLGQRYAIVARNTKVEGGISAERTRVPATGFIQHLHGSRETLVRLARDTCTARERHLYGSRATLAPLASRASVPQKARRRPQGQKKREHIRTGCTLFFIFSLQGNGLGLHSVVFVRNSQFLATFSTTCCQYSAAIGCSHSLTETVFVSSLSVGGLKCSFHYCIFFTLLFSRIRAAKIETFFKITKR